MSEYLSVTQLNYYIKSIVESDFSLMNILVIGEVSTLTKHYSGHYYFTLKDESSQIKCMMFSNYVKQVDFNLENGQEVLIEGHLGVYEKNGTYQLYCRKISLYGEGQYLLKLAALKEKLKKEGLFDLPKKNIPLLPKRIGVVTSKEGAAIFDFITTIKKRGNTEVYLFPCLVQGIEASKDILRAVKESLDYNIDLLVITRGGGSKEDLKAFNDEALVKFVASINLPVITAIGHRIDTTLIDYVSSYSCITPTDAANHSIASQDDIRLRLKELEKFLDLKFKRFLDKKMERILLLSQTIETYSPINRFKLLQSSIRNNTQKIDYQIGSFLSQKYQTLLDLMKKGEINQRSRLLSYYNKLQNLMNKISYLNPYSLLESGYTFIVNEEDKIVSSVENIKIGQNISIRLKDGLIKATVEEVKHDI